MLIRPHHHKNTEPHGFEFTKDSHHCLGIDLCSFINLRIHSKGKSDMTKYSSAHWGESQGWLVIVCLGSQSHQFYVVSKEEYHHWVSFFQKGLLHQVVPTCSGLGHGVLVMRRKGR